MPDVQLIGKRASAIDSIRTVLDDWRHKRRSARELDQCGDDEVARMARDMQMSSGQLRRMARVRADAADLLLGRMAALGLDPGSILQEEPAVFRDLQRLCSFCATRKRCRRELAADPQNGIWREHCPNAGTLAALEADGAVNH